MQTYIIVWNVFNMNSENSCEKQIVRVSSKKWDRENDEHRIERNNIQKNGANNENAEAEEEVVDPYTQKRRESLKNFVYDISGKVSSSCFRRLGSCEF